MANEKVKEFILKNNVHTVFIGFVDIAGVLRAKLLDANYFLDSVTEKGVRISKACYAWDCNCGMVDDMGFVGWETGYQDMILKPDFSTLVPMPWRGGYAMLLGDTFCPSTNEPMKMDPRYVLRRVIDMAADMGYSINIGSELEFFIVGNDKQPVKNNIQYINPYTSYQTEYIFDDMRLNLAQMGIVLEAGVFEYAAGLQYEINLSKGEGMLMADKTVYFKNTVKEIARKHEHYATFMAKPYQEDTGSGFHIHISLWDKEGKNNLYSEDEQLVKYSLGGMLKYMPEVHLFGNQTINSYKRMVPYGFVPLNTTWGYDDRNVGVRSMLGIGKATRLEHRSSAADANPYLAMAGVIASTLEGIAAKIEPPPPVVGRNANFDPDAELLPTSMEGAIERFENSSFARKYFGDDFVDCYLKICKHELNEFKHAVTDWEFNRYFEIV